MQVAPRRRTHRVCCADHIPEKNNSPKELQDINPKTFYLDIHEGGMEEAGRTGENSFLKKEPLRASTAARSLSAYRASTVTVASGAAQSASTS